MPDIPSGTATFLFIDIEGSIRLWEERPDAIRLALARHDEIAASVVREFAGTLVKFAFDTAPPHLDIISGPAVNVSYTVAYRDTRDSDIGGICPKITIAAGS